MPKDNITHILDFWFGELDETGQVLKSVQDSWWRKDPKFDAAIKAEFLPLMQKAKAGELQHWQQSPQGTLALIILLDQFSRNVYRNSSQAFACDPLARQVALEGITKQQDKTLLHIQRVFFYMPLEHAESLEMQKQSVSLFTDLYEIASDDQKAQYAYFLDYAQQHHDVIETYARFPHRNAVLQRDNTAAEVEYLARPEAGF